MTTSIAEQLDANATADPDGVWITTPTTGATVTWAEAARHARSIACQLDTLGLQPGSSVAVAAPNSIWATLCFTGVAYGGYLATPLNLVAGGAGSVLCARPFRSDRGFVRGRMPRIDRGRPRSG